MLSTRRNLMTGGAALAVAAVIPVAASKADDDADTSALARECLAQALEDHRLWMAAKAKRPRDVSGRWLTQHAGWPAYEAAYDVHTVQSRKLRGIVETLRRKEPTTAAGKAAKASALLAASVITDDDSDRRAVDLAVAFAREAVKA